MTKPLELWAIHVIAEQRSRALDKEHVKALAESIREIGLLHPISVTPNGMLIAGWHRLEACRSLGWKEIPVVLVRLDDLRREMAEIHENLIADRGSAIERAEWMARCKELYLQLHPETERGASGRFRARSTPNGDLVPCFAESASKATRQSKGTVNDYVRIGSVLDEEERAAVKGTVLANSKRELLRLIREPKKMDRLQIVSKVASGAAKTVDQAANDAPIPTRRVRAVAERDEKVRRLLGDGLGVVEIAKKLGVHQHAVSESKAHIQGRERERERNPLRRVTEIAAEFSDALRDQASAGEMAWCDASGKQRADAVRALKELRRTVRMVIQRLNKEAKGDEYEDQARQANS